MKPLRQGEMDVLCGLYAVANALRVCSGGALTANHLRVLFKAMVRDMGPEMARVLCSGSTDDDVARYLRVATALAKRKYGLSFRFRYRCFGRYETLHESVEKHLAQARQAVILSADRHLTVAVGVTANLWQLVDSDGYKYLHAVEGPITRQKPLLRAMPELEVFWVEGE